MLIKIQYVYLYLFLRKHMKKFAPVFLLLTSFILFDNFKSNAQTLNWGHAFGNGGDDRIFSINNDNNGNQYLCGKFSGTVDFDFGPATYNLVSNGSSDGFVAKYDPIGNFLWAYHFGGGSIDEATACVVDNDGDLIIVGYFRGPNVDFDPGPANYFLTSNGDNGSEVGYGGDAFVCKLSPSGSFVWAFSVGGYYLHDEWWDVDVDAQKNIYVGGHFNCSSSSPVDLDPGPGIHNIAGAPNGFGVFAKYDQNGNFVWARNFGDYGVSSSIQYLKADINQNAIVMLGHIKATSIDFDPGPGTSIASSNGGSDIWLCKYSLNGDLIWNLMMGGNPTLIYKDVGTDLELDANSNIYITGYYEGTNVNFNPLGAPALSSANAADIVFAKYKPDGNLIWHRNIGDAGNENEAHLAINGSVVFLSGTFTSCTLDLDPSINTTNVTSVGGQDAFISKFDTTGNFLCGFSIGGSGNEIVRELDSKGNQNIVQFAGQFWSSNFDIDPSPSTVIVSQNGGGDAVWASYSVSGGSPLPSGYFIGDTVCNGQPVMLTFIDTTSSVGPYSISISNGSNQFTFNNVISGVPFSTTINTSGQYVITSFNGGTPTCGTFQLDTMIANILILTPNININASATNICAGNAITLNANGGVSYTWSNGVINGVSFIPQQTTVYTVTGTDANGCTGTSSILISVVPNLPITASAASPQICSNQSTLLTASGAGVINFIWSPNNSLSSPTGASVTANPSGSTVYTVTGTDANGCIGTSTVYVEVINDFHIDVSKDRDAMCGENYVRLNATGADNYTWSPSLYLNNNFTANPQANIGSTITYYVVGTKGTCTDIDSITVYYYDNSESGIFIPNAFTPNNDGLNDCFKVITKGKYAYYKFMIYNRWGMPVFESDNPEDCWDGTTFGADNVPIGTYYYFLRVNSECGMVRKKGDITVIR